MHTIFATYACATQVDGDIYLEHDVSDIELKVKVPRCINGMRACKAKCGFLVLCSKVDHNHTYAINTLVNTHICARVLNNRSANSKWVDNAIVKKMKTFEIMKIHDRM